MYGRRISKSYRNRFRCNVRGDKKLKIDNFKINSFGKLKNKEIKLDSGINIISGKNEAGKSTVLKFISSMLYGVSKNKNGKEISDFDKFKPWDTD